ncbi:uncharacterized protein LOC131147662 isoform X2 [Malania oleifera]|uniref:uncharacterized protein LOC131147662 isoform X2 n=1 Tax=Malania oleifera TaxID=397392 RepID=UPI0025AEA600|nr:uncharacterized protein LOC131147662 isoform X2 [Malania oleifera]
MVAESKSNTTTAANPSHNKKKRPRYLPHNKPVKKGLYPLRPGVQGFFITCDGGRERQASHEAINVIDSFYEELVQGKDSSANLGALANIPLNTKTKFTYSDSSGSDDDDCGESGDEGEKKEVQEAEKKLDSHIEGDANNKSSTNEKSDPCKGDDERHEIEREEMTNNNKEELKYDEHQAKEAEEPPAKKQCHETATSKSGNFGCDKVEKSIDKLIEAEIEELGDRNKRRFSSLDSGCNGVVFVQMRKRDGDPSPKDIVQHMMTSAASTRKQMSRFILRVLPVEVTCYCSEEDITRAIKPIIAGYFPVEVQTPQKCCMMLAQILVLRE